MRGIRDGRPRGDETCRRDRFVPGVGTDDFVRANAAARAKLPQLVLARLTLGGTLVAARKMPVNATPDRGIVCSVSGI
jgi:hypothetical protein